METSLILAQQIMELIRNAGCSQLQAHGALRIAGILITSADDMTFQNVSSDAQAPPSFPAPADSPSTFNPADLDRQVQEAYRDLARLHQYRREAAGVAILPPPLPLKV